MRSIRKYAYAAVLALTAVSFTPRAVAGDELARGTFTLTHDVHWQNALVPAGDYRFSWEADGVAGKLVLSKVSGASAGFLLVARDTEEMSGTGSGRLLLESTAEGSYVRRMQLPEFGIALNFRVPAAKQLARTVTTASAAAR